MRLSSTFSNFLRKCESYVNTINVTTLNKLNLDKTSLGSLTFDIDDEESHSKKYLVQHYYRLKNFDPNVDLTHGYDIVALKLKEEISFDNYRQKLNPCQGKVGSKDVDDNQVWAVGFGYTDSHGTRPDKLMASIFHFKHGS